MRDQEILKKRKQVEPEIKKQVITEAYLYIMVTIVALFVVLAMKGESNYDVDDRSKKHSKTS